MGAIPLPALDIKPLEQQPNLLDQFARVTQIRSLLQDSQLKQQQIQEGQMNQRDEQLMRDAWQNSAGNPDQYVSRMQLLGVSPKHVIEQSKALLLMKQESEKLDEATLKNSAAAGDQYRGRILSIVGLPEEAKAPAWAQEITAEEQAGKIKPGTWSHEYPGDAVATSLANHMALGSVLAKEALEAKTAATGQQRLALETPGIVARGQQAQQEASMTPAQRAMQSNLPYQAAGGDPQARNAMQMEQQGKINVAAAEARARATAGGAGNETSDDELARGMVDGSVDIAKVASIRSGRREALVKQAMKLDPTFSMSTYPQRLRIQEKFSSGKAADQIASLNTFAGHIADASDLVDSLRNSNSPWLNAPLNKAAVGLGNDKIGPFQAALEASKDEYLNFLKAGHAPQQQELQLADKLLNANLSPAQLQSVFKQMTNTILIRAGSLNSEYARTMHKDYPMLSQESVQALSKLGYGDRAAKFASGGPAAAGGSNSPSPTAVGPNGHRIKLVSGRWVDAQTGAPIQ